MKKRFVFCAVAVAVSIAGLRAVPQVVQSSIPSIYYVTPNQKIYENVVNCSGTIQSERVQEIYLQSSLVAGEVYVSVGDYVREGDTLLRVDQEKTNSLSLSGLSVPDQLLGGDVSGADLSSIVSAYGFSSLLGLDLDTSSLSALLGQEEGEQRSTVTGVSVVEEGEEIEAPISGVITEVNILPDMPMSGGRSIFTITDTNSYKVMATVSEGDIAKINLGDGVKIRGVGFSGTSYTGVVSKIYPTARKVLSGTTTETVVDVEILLLDPDSRLKPGFSAKVEITGGNLYEIITVPYEAVRQDENNDEYVYTYQDGKLEKTTIITGQELTSEVEVLEGLEADSVVIYNPDDIAKEGTMIQIKGRADVD